METACAPVFGPGRGDAALKGTAYERGETVGAVCPWSDDVPSGGRTISVDIGCTGKLCTAGCALPSLGLLALARTRVVGAGGQRVAQAEQPGRLDALARLLPACERREP